MSDEFNNQETVNNEAGETGESKETKDFAENLVENLKELVKKGDVTRIKIKHENNVVLNIPMNVGIVGTILGAAVAPWALILLTITTLGFNCAVIVEDKEGKETYLHGKK